MLSLEVMSLRTLIEGNFSINFGKKGMKLENSALKEERMKETDSLWKYSAPTVLARLKKKP